MKDFKDFGKLIFWGVAVSIGLLVVGGAGVIVSQRFSGTPNQPGSAVPPMSKEGTTLGGGYKGAKWGMSKGEVKRSLGGTVKAEGDEYVTIGLDGEKELECWFWNGRLRKVRYLPNLQDGDEAGHIAIIRLLVEKYGNTKPSPGYVDRVGLPLDVLEWKDGETTISFEMLSKTLAEKSGIELPTSTLHVVYSSDKLEAEKKSSLGRAERNQAEDAINKKKAAVSQDL